MSQDLIAFQTNERRSPVPEIPRIDNHNYRYHRYLLSLDGGGVRGLSTLLILKNIMHQVNAKRRERGFTCDLKPCDVFDLIGGTSTGGLIAIMLGRLEMDVDSCLEAYREFIPQAFSEPSTIPFTWTGKVYPRYSSKNMREAVTKIIERRMGGSKEKDPSRLLLRETSLDPENMCRVFVCVTPGENPRFTSNSLLRSYPVPFENVSVPFTIVQAALATTAASSFFAPVVIPLPGGGSRKYIDGALGANNPVQVVENEARDVFLTDGSRTITSTPDFVPCFLSIGTGVLGKTDSDSLEKASKFIRTLASIVTDTEKTAEEFERNWERSLRPHSGYYRFNVEQGPQRVTIAAKNPEGRIEAFTEDYLGGQKVRKMLLDCAGKLADKQYPPSSIVSLIDAGEKFLENRWFSEACEKFAKAEELLHHRNPDDVDRSRIEAVDLGLATALYEKSQDIREHNYDAKVLCEMLDQLNKARVRVNDHLPKGKKLAENLESEYEQLIRCMDGIGLSVGLLKGLNSNTTNGGSSYHGSSYYSYYSCESI